MRKEYTLLTDFTYSDKIIEKSGDARIYRDALILTPGIYSDSVVKSKTNFSSKELSKAINRWESNFLNLDHSRKTLDRIGYVKNIYWKDGIFGDLYIYPITTNAKDAISLIDAGLVNSLSIEMTAEDKWDPIENIRVATDIIYFGVAIVTQTGCKDSRIIWKKEK